MTIEKGYRPRIQNAKAAATILSAVPTEVLLQFKVDQLGRAGLKAVLWELERRGQLPRKEVSRG